MTTLQEKIGILRRKLKAYRDLQELGEDRASEIEALEAELQTLIQTEGGAYVGGNVDTDGGNFTGRDMSVQAGPGGMAAGGFPLPGVGGKGRPFSNFSSS